MTSHLLDAPLVREAAAALSAGVLLPAAIGHLATLRQYRGTLLDYGLPLAAAKPLAWLLPLAMIAAALGGLHPAVRTPALLTAAGLFGLFAGAIGINLLRGRADLGCGCAPWSPPRRISTDLAARNLAYGGFCLWGAAQAAPAEGPWTAILLLCPLLCLAAAQAARTELAQLAPLGRGAAR